MKNIKRIVIAFCLIVGMINCYSLNVFAIEKIELTTKVQSTTKVRLTWKKQKGVDGYKIYREVDNDTKLVLIADLGKNITLYVDKNLKPNKVYSYEISGYRKKNGKEIEKFWGCESVKTGLSNAVNYAEEFDEDIGGIYDRVITTSRQITIPIGIYDKGAVIDVDIMAKNGLRPDGVEVFKKVGKKYVSYKRIKIKNEKKKRYYFTDKNVKKGKKYRYKFRTYKKMNGKMKYTPLTGPFIACAMNNQPSIDIKVIEPFDFEKNTMTVCIINQEDYGALSDFSQWVYYRWNVGVSGGSMTSMEMMEYSNDMHTWDKNFKQFKIKPGKSMYIRLKVAEEDFADITTSSQITEDIDFCFRHKFYSYSYEYQITENNKNIYHD